MANIQQIVNAMQDARIAIAVKYGVDLTPGHFDATTAFIIATNDALLAIVIGVLVDQAVPRGNGSPLTLAVFNNALTAALSQAYTPPQVPEKPPPGSDGTS